ncbi:hypothetical protein [Pseudonocardia alni]|uniref:Uncharacterized protein n=1 Tax=Pseudonocardia alni TaxID=33907 RepID=A0A852VU03_PSEA5|nr:hypothetical protein [Pseudonocardia antarctica]NYG00373.1 hypothetical protein [Pseudonocardia antarctica]
MPEMPSAAALRARAARLTRDLGSDHPEARTAWRDALGQQFTEYAERVATRAPRFTPDQLARIGAVLDGGTDSRATVAS